VTEASEKPTAAPPASTDPRPVLMLGELVDETYEVRNLLGAGGMGEVYEAHDRVLNRRVALKVHPGGDSEYLLREGRALAAIHHPGIVAVHTMGMHRGVPFLVMERVRGLSVDRLLDERRARGERFGIAEALELLVAVADALSVVHRAGLAHRDVKPGNVMLAPAGRVVLMDFGLVLPHADRAGHRSVAGSLQYMAPEALSGDVAEGAAGLVDVYALGVLAYELLTGFAPFDGAEPVELYRAKTRAKLPRVREHRPDVAAELDEAGVAAHGARRARPTAGLGGGALAAPRASHAHGPTRRGAPVLGARGGRRRRHARGPRSAPYVVVFRTSCCWISICRTSTASRCACFSAGCSWATRAWWSP